jgi:predicted AlkP superfamily pyrophosphatase or phosphodiesterase
MFRSSLGISTAGAVALGLSALPPLGCRRESGPSAVAPAPAPIARPTSASDASTLATAKGPAKRVIVFVWDGLRPDSITLQDTPRLAELARTGTNFADHHATYPSFTMVNGSSLATGGSLETNGFYGNWLWQPAAAKRSPSGAPLLTDAGTPVHYDAPVFTEDYTVVRDLDDFYGGDLLQAGSLFEVARARGLTTAAIGKSGPAYLQDRHKLGYILDEKAAWPSSLVKELQAAGVRVPKGTVNAYPPGDASVDDANGDPTAIPPSKKLADGQSTDPTDTSGGPASRDNAYLMDAYLRYILPEKKPDLTFVWFRNPDTAEHWYGPGTTNVKQSLRDMDALLGKLLDELSALGWRDSTDVIIVSDHGHSTVSGRLEFFPLRAIAPGKTPSEGGTIGAKDPSGYSVSGDVRLADLFTRIGKFRAFDGIGCLYNPVLSGIAPDGKPLYPTHTDDTNGTVCGKDPKTGKTSLKYNTPPYRVPATLPADALIVAVNGGSDYVYVPSHDAAVVQRVVRFLQGREEVGPLFVSSRYSPIAGTLPMAMIGIENKEPRRIPDIVVGYDYDENATVAGMRGISYEGAQNYRGMHGSFSPVDIHNTLVAKGPDFREGWVDSLPTANVDVAPTVGLILGLPLAKADGRPLREALSSGVGTTDYKVDTPEPITSPPATGLRVFLPTDTDGSRVDKSKTNYRVVLKTRKVVRDGQSYTYYDWAKAVRD